MLAKRGDRSAFDALVRRYEELAFRAAYLVVRNEDEAADIAQDAFVRAYRGLRSLDTERPFRPWLLRIVTNVARNSTRASKRRAAATERLVQIPQNSSALPLPEQAAVSAESAERLWGAIGELRDDDQRLIYLRYFLDLSEAEAAESIGRPKGTVKSRLHRALKRLRDVLEHGYPDLLPERVLDLIREETHEPAAKS